MPRPKNASYKSYKLISQALSEGRKYFEELRNITNLHRNTLNTRLDFLVSEGLVVKSKEGPRTYYQKVQGYKWIKYCLKREEVKQLKKQLKKMMKENIEVSRSLDRALEVIANFDERFDELADSDEGREVLDSIDNCQDAPITKIWLILALNDILINLNSKQLICPECYSLKTVTDNKTNETICEKCGFVIGDEIIALDKRLKIVLTFIEERQN
jgi:DNA-binding HxlR family transcriptional regulator